MKIALLPLAIIVVATVNATSHLAEQNRKFINAEIVDQIKSQNKWTPFEADENPLLHTRDIQSMIGTASRTKNTLFAQLLGNSKLTTTGFDAHKTFSEQISNLKSTLLGAPSALKSSTLLPAFDSRTQWSSCIHAVRDQKSCGSCWAHASAGFLEDRFCIASSGSIDVRLAPQDMVNCAFMNSGCNGGFLTFSLNYLQQEGLVSETCLPYQNAVDYCMYRCASPSTPFQKYQCKADSMKLFTTPEDIQQEIKTNGPMMVGFTIYADLYSYSSGIYENVSTVIDGGHAVKLIGWYYDGPSNDLIWICQNQWGTAWGENGFFNIRHGVAGLDIIAFACDPAI